MNQLDLTDLEEYIAKLPKAELHVHLEGALEPELMFKIAQRNKVDIPYKSVEQVKLAYQFSCLQDFLDIYYEGAQVLLHHADFYDLTYAYLKKAHHDQVKHVEVFFDPQTHTDRGVPFSEVIHGITDALKQGEKEFGISSFLILCFLRHLDQESAFKTLHQALPYKHKIIGVGLDSSEVGNPPSKFKDVFKEARNAGFLAVSHAGEEGPLSYVEDTLSLLNVDRIDHGNRCVESEALMTEIAEKKLALTMCPLSNVNLKVVDDLRNYPIRKLWKYHIRVTLNSDDPAYFGGYINKNYLEVAKSIGLGKLELKRLAKDSFLASFLAQEEKDKYLALFEKV